MEEDHRDPPPVATVVVVPYAIVVVVAPARRRKWNTLKAIINSSVFFGVSLCVVIVGMVVLFIVMITGMIHRMKNTSF
jgi:uncharacterized membrane protein